MCTRTQGPHRDWPECLLCLPWRYESAVACCRRMGSGCSRAGLYSMWHGPSWRRSPLPPPWGHRAPDPKTAEQLFQRNSCTVKKVLGPTTEFPTWGSGKGTEKLKVLTLEASGIWLQNLHRTGETDSWRAQTKFVCTRTQVRGAVTPQKTDPNLPVSVQESLVEAGVSSGLLQGRGYWVCQCLHRTFWRRSALSPLPPQ